MTILPSPLTLTPAAHARLRERAKHENYCDKTEDQLDLAGEGPTGSIIPWENYIDKNLPMLWIPLDDFKIMAVSKKLTGVTFSNRLSIFPQDWSFKK